MITPAVWSYLLVSIGGHSGLGPRIEYLAVINLLEIYMLTFCADLTVDIFTTKYLWRFLRRCKQVAESRSPGHTQGSTNVEHVSRKLKK